jgi:hypothetical protein
MKFLSIYLLFYHRHHHHNFFSGDFLGFFMYCIQHCFICRPSDSTVSEDAGIELRTVATTALIVRRSNTRLNIIHHHHYHHQISKSSSSLKNQRIIDVMSFNIIFISIYHHQILHWHHIKISVRISTTSLHHHR